MNKTIVHIASEKLGEAQYCARCGAEIWNSGKTSMSPLPATTKVSMDGDAFIFHYGSLDPERYALCAPSIDTVQGILPRDRR